MSGSGDFSIGSTVWPGTSKVIEECGELQQALGKLIATHGDEAHWDGSNLRQRIEDEMADVAAAIAFFGKVNGLNREVMGQRIEEKMALFEKWHSEQAVAEGQEEG